MDGAVAAPRGRTTRASAASEAQRKQDATGASPLTKPGAAFHSPFSPYKTSPASKPSSRSSAKASEAAHTAAPPPSSSTCAVPVTPTSAPVPSAQSVAPESPPSPAPKQAPASQATATRSSPTRRASPSPSPVAQSPAAPPRLSPPPVSYKPAARAASPVSSPTTQVKREDVKKEEDQSSEDRSGSKASQGGPTRPIIPPTNKQERPPGYVHGNEGRNRSPYKCNKCGQPKKGHVCPSVLVPPTAPIAGMVKGVGSPSATALASQKIASPTQQIGRTEEPYANWFDMALSSLDFLRTSLVNHQEKMSTWTELRNCRAYIIDVQTRLRAYKDSLRQADHQTRLRGIPVRVRGVDPSEAEAVEGLLRSLSEPREGNLPATKRIRSSDKGDDTEQEEGVDPSKATKAPKSRAVALDEAATSAGGSQHSQNSAPQQQTASAESRKRTLLASSDDDTAPPPIHKAQRSIKSTPAQPVLELAESDSDTGTKTGSQTSHALTSGASAGSQTLAPPLSSQLSQPTASQTEQEISRMLASPPLSQEMAPPAPKLMSPVKRNLLASDELLRTAPPMQHQGSSQPLSQVSDLDLEHAPDVV